MSPSSVTFQKNLKQHDVHFCSSLLPFFFISMVFYSFMGVLLMSWCHFWRKNWHTFLCKSLFESRKTISRTLGRRSLSLSLLWYTECLEAFVFTFKLDTRMMCKSKVEYIWRCTKVRVRIRCLNLCMLVQTESETQKDSNVSPSSKSIILYNWKMKLRNRSFYTIRRWRSISFSITPLHGLILDFLPYWEWRTHLSFGSGQCSSEPSSIRSTKAFTKPYVVSFFFVTFDKSSNTIATNQNANTEIRIYESWFSSMGRGQ